MPHIILLGDSIFDNLKYVQPEPDVATRLRQTVPAGWKVTLRAIRWSGHQRRDQPASRFAN